MVIRIQFLIKHETQHEDACGEKHEGHNIYTDCIQIWAELFQHASKTISHKSNDAVLPPKHPINTSLGIINWNQIQNIVCLAINYYMYVFVLHA